MEGMAGRVVEVLDHRSGGLLADLALLLPGIVHRVEGVLFAVVGLNGGVDPAEAVRDGLADAVERDRGADAGPLLGRQQEDEPATHTESDGADGRGGHALVRQQEVHRAAEVPRRAVLRQIGHELTRLVGVMGHPAAEQVGRECDEALAGERVRDTGDVVGEPPPLLDDDDARPAARGGEGEIAVCRRTVARERDVLEWVLVRADVLDHAVSPWRLRSGARREMVRGGAPGHPPTTREPSRHENGARVRLHPGPADPADRAFLP